MSLGTLSPEIINNIVSYTIEAPAYDIEEWCSQLPLLGLCRKWRAVAAPLVFSQLYISTVSGTRQSEPGKCANEDYYIDEGDVVELDSNISLVASGGYHSAVRQLDIRVESNEDTLDILNSTCQLLGSRSLTWKGIAWLRTSFMLDELAIEADKEGDFSRLDSRATQLCDAFARLLPNITHIDTLGTSASTPCCLFMSKVVDVYSQQLRHLDSSFPLLLMSPQFSDRLEHLGVEFDEAIEEQFPYVYPQSLRYLSLGNISSKSIWHFFYDETHAAGIEFSRLRQLSMAFNPAVEKESSDEDFVSARLFGKLSFPALSRLSFSLCPSVHGVLAQASFASSLKTLQIICPMGGVVTLSDVLFDSLTRGALAEHVAGSNLFKDFSRTPNFLLTASSFAKSVSFHVDSVTEISDDAVIKWENLTQLSIDSRISSAKLLSLISGLPQLATLDAANVAIGGSAPGVPSLDPTTNHDWPSMPPFDTRLRNLRLWFQTANNASDLEAALVKVLLARIPTLQTIQVPAGAYGLDAFINEHAAQLPHLRRFCTSP
ncbi:hypothetical protein GGF46_001899 [Coemansia sp. RSA 552]|nr:hypothetical protein GGF46_001899 [Coemansia sp. RSA 552]